MPASANLPSPSDLAVGIVTFERPAVVLRLIHSVRARFPDIPIYVADQSRDVEPMMGAYEAFGVRLVSMTFDAGLSASRNRLTEVIAEDYFVLCDDDFLFKPETDFDDALALLR